MTDYQLNNDTRAHIRIYVVLNLNFSLNLEFWHPVLSNLWNSPDIFVEIVFYCQVKLCNVDYVQHVYGEGEGWASLIETTDLFLYACRTVALNLWYFYQQFKKYLQQSKKIEVIFTRILIYFFKKSQISLQNNNKNFKVFLRISQIIYKVFH